MESDDKAVRPLASILDDKRIALIECELRVAKNNIKAIKVRNIWKDKFTITPGLSGNGKLAVHANQKAMKINDRDTTQDGDDSDEMDVLLIFDFERSNSGSINSLG